MHYTRADRLREAEAQEAEASAMDDAVMALQVERNRIEKQMGECRDIAARLRAGAAQCREWAKEDPGAVVIEDGEVVS